MVFHCDRVTSVPFNNLNQDQANVNVTLQRDLSHLSLGLGVIPKLKNRR